jgi:hypothetical protein
LNREPRRIFRDAGRGEVLGECRIRDTIARSDCCYCRPVKDREPAIAPEFALRKGLHEHLENVWPAPPQPSAACSRRPARPRHRVGYGKPQKHSHFKPGHSGNRLGKPSGTKNSATLLKRALLESVVIKRHGRESKATKLEVIVTQIVKQAVLCDFASIRLLLNYTGLDHELDEVQKAAGGLSHDAAEMIRRAGDEYLPERLASQRSWV